MLSDGRGERGFTMIELLVVTALLMIAVAMTSMFLISSLRSAQQVTGASRAQASSNDLLDQLGADVRQATGFGRTSPSPTDDELRSFVRTNAPTSFRDITFASSTQLWIVTDAIAEPIGAAPAPECVGYVDLATELVRRVYASATPCPAGGTPIEEQRMVRRAGAGTTPRFRYVLEYNPDIAGTSGAVDVDNCSVRRDVQLPGGAPSVPLDSKLPAIIAVQVDASSFENGGAQESTPTSSVSFLSRRTSRYRQALGCSYG
jgi:type II secretory pathway pseudopilin PulG